MDLFRCDGDHLDDERINFFRAFGYMVFRGMFTSDAMERMRIEVMQTMSEQYEHRPFSPGAAAESDRRRWVLMMDSDARIHAPLLEHPRFVGLARRLYGSDLIGIKVQANRFGGDTPWHRDTYTASRGGIKFIWYYERLDGTNGALRLIPLTHLLGDSYLFSEKLRRLRMRDVPCTVLESDPGDVIAFDMRPWHGSFGGEDRSESSLTYYNDPRSEEEEEALRLRAWTNLNILLDRFGCKRRYFYSREWIENRGGSEIRGQWIRRLREVGYFDAPGVVEPGAMIPDSPEEAGRSSPLSAGALSDRPN